MDQKFKMGLVFAEKYNPVDEEGIRAFCAKHGFPDLPNAYRDFLLKYNGGVPDTDGFIVDGCKTYNGSIIHTFYGIHNGDFGSTIDWMLDVHGKRWPKNLLPIASDGFGNVLLLALSGIKRNRVYIWLHDMDFADTRNRSWENIHFVAKSFELFIESLEPSGILVDKEDELREICKQGKYSELEILLKNGLPPDTRTKRKHTLAETCAAFGHLEMLKLLLKYGASLKKVACDAIGGRQTETALFLLREIEDPLEKWTDGWTWLHLAAEYHLPEVVKYLIEKGCPVNQQDEKGFSPLVYADYTDYPEKDETIRIIELAGGKKLYQKEN